MWLETAYLVQTSKTLNHISARCESSYTAHRILIIMRRVKVVLEHGSVAEELPPLQKGLRKAVSMDYYTLDPVQEESVDRMRAIGLLKVGMDGSISPTKMGKGIMDGTIGTSKAVPPFVAGLVR